MRIFCVLGSFVAAGYRKQSAFALLEQPKAWPNSEKENRAMGLYLNSENAGKVFGKWTQLGSSFTVWLDGRPKSDKVAVFERNDGKIAVMRCDPPALKRFCGVRKPGAESRPEHVAWRGMISRCYNKNSTGYENYGGRGIRVCVEWLRSSERFIADMGPRPSLCHSLDRIDNNGNYEPSNCRWATKIEQRANQRPKCRVAG